ncbi:MAG TPA: uracil-DNA glycosylase [Brumimicrobium sp.]|nr:uracil-DNA glycosylase [Brumimicrobium sp.]
MFDITASWNRILQAEFEKEYYQNLLAFLEEEYSEHEVFPPKNQVYNAFNITTFENVKVVVIGQDPYHDVSQAHGLCFSVNEGIKLPPSLVNIFKEQKEDLGLEIPFSGKLTSWAEQGVLLLNATLTVRAHQAGSHQKKGWETFTDEVIKIISKEKKDVIFLLWGGFAKKKASLIDAEKHHILTSGHPSPLSANRGHWFGNKHFSKVNEILKSIGKKEIDWELKSEWNQ